MLGFRFGFRFGFKFGFRFGFRFSGLGLEGMLEVQGVMVSVRV